MVLPVVPDPLNLFQNSGPRPDGTPAIGPAASPPGDAVTFLARRDLVVIVTARAVDYPPLDQGHGSPLRTEIHPGRCPIIPLERGSPTCPNLTPAIHNGG